VGGRLHEVELFPIWPPPHVPPSAVRHENPEGVGGDAERDRGTPGRIRRAR